MFIPAHPVKGNPARTTHGNRIPLRLLLRVPPTAPDACFTASARTAHGSRVPSHRSCACRSQHRMSVTLFPYIPSLALEPVAPLQRVTSRRLPGHAAPAR